MGKQNINNSNELFYKVEELCKVETYQSITGVDAKEICHYNQDGIPPSIYIVRITCNLQINKFSCK